MLSKNKFTIIDILIARSKNQRDVVAYKFISESSTQQITYKELNTKARSIAAWFQKYEAKGQRAMLLLQPGLDYIAAFLGCLYAGVIAVPAYPPRSSRHMERLQSIINDADAKFILTSRDIADRNLFSQEAVLIVDELNGDLAYKWEACDISEEDLAFLQYTSGSTGNPKGVMVTHANIMANLKYISNAGENRQHKIGAVANGRLWG